MERMGECRRRRSLLCMTGHPDRGSQGICTMDDPSMQIISAYPDRESSQLFFREFNGRLWYITITERKKARTAKIWSRRKCRFNSCRGHQYTAPWCRWLTRLPVTQEIAGSSPVGVAKWPLSSTGQNGVKQSTVLCQCCIYSIQHNKKERS